MNKVNLIKILKKYYIHIIAVVAVVFSIYMYLQLHNLNTNPQAEAKKEATDLIEKVGKIIVLPKDEIPTIATVSDPSVLKDQAFFNNAQKGDKVLIFAQAKKAILYSPDQNKIIEVAPLNMGEKKIPTLDNTESQAPAVAPAKTPAKKK